MKGAIQKTPRSDELLQALLTHSADLVGIEAVLKLEKYSGDEVSRAGSDYAMECWSECLDYVKEPLNKSGYFCPHSRD